MKELGIVGFGHFGQFMSKHLKAFFDVTVYDVVDASSEAQALGVHFGSFEDVVSKDIVIFAVPVQCLRDVLVKAAPLMKANALAVDVSSVKVRPIELMLECLPSSVRIIGTHPLFGPESGKNGIEGLKIVLCDVRDGGLESVRRLCETKLGLQVLVRTADEHDKEMAMVQGLTHFLAKALMKMDLKQCEMDTVAYNRMMDVMSLVGHDSMALFETIQKQNPYCAEVRKQFMDAFSALEDGLK